MKRTPSRRTEGGREIGGATESGQTPSASDVVVCHGVSRITTGTGLMTAGFGVVSFLLRAGIMMIPHRGQSLVILISLVAGCGSGAEGGDGSAPAVGPVSDQDAPETAVSVLCEAFEDCGCQAASMPAESCDVRIETQMDRALDDAAAAGLEYDAACMGQLLTAVRQFGCEQLSDFTLEELLDLTRSYDCKVFYGSVTSGRECTTLAGLGDSCVRDARCVEQKCAVIPATAAEGQECEDDFEFLTAACEPGTVCVDVDDAGSPRCLRPPERGDRCVGSEQLCGLGLACVDETCERPPDEGQPCHPGGGASCGEDLRCDWDAGICVPDPTDGEECEFSCARGFECAEGRCREEQPLVCSAELYDVDE